MPPVRKYPGEKGYGGRKPGSRGKKVIERELIQARIMASQMADARSPGHEPLAKELLRSFAIAFGNIAAHYQPEFGVDEEGNEIVKKGNLAEFKEWGRLSIEAASKWGSNKTYRPHQ
jgi:hypothetical protein